MVSAQSILRRVNAVSRFVRPMARATDVLEQIATLPWADLPAITAGRRILVLAPHPDDESLGCGGLIIQAVQAGLDVHVAILTDGSRSHPNSKTHPAARLKSVREAEAAAAVAILGVARDHLWFMEYPDGSAPQRGRGLRAAGARLAERVSAHGIETVFSTWAHDPHHDHLSAHRVTREAARAVAFRHLSYPVWGWTLPGTAWLARAPLQGYRLDVSQTLPRKRQAIACHISQTTDMISDDPAGFSIPDRLYEICDRPFEAFILNGAPHP